MHKSSYDEMKKFIINFLDPKQEYKILDIGSMDVNGSYRDLFDNSSWQYTGYDIESGPNVDIVKLPAPGQFDVVITGSVLEHVKDTHKFVLEAKSMLKPDGIMCIIAPWVYPEHKYPVDCWRIMPDGMRFLLGDIAELPILGVWKNETDCVGIAGMLKKRRKIAFGTMVNDIMRLNMVFAKSELDPKIPCHTIKMPETACKGLNKLLDIMTDAGDEIAVLAHQDMFFRVGWIEQMESQIARLPDSWVVAGVIGKDYDGAICGRIHDMRIPLHFSTGHEYPCEASCFDECCIVVNLSKGFRFDENMPGFDLYGTLCVLQSQEIGGTAWVIDAFCEHYCMRPFTWYPDQKFADCFKWLYTRFPNARKIDSTVLGVERKNKETGE